MHFYWSQTGANDVSAGPDNHQQKKVKQILSNKHQSQGKKDAVNTKSKASQMKVIKALFVVCGLFFICFLPSVIFLALAPVLSTEQREFGFTFASIFAFMNCAVNPGIYVGMHSTIRKRFLETIQFWK